MVLLRKYSIITASTLDLSDRNQLHVVLGVIILALHMHDNNEPFGRETPSQSLLHRYEMISLTLLTFVIWSVFFSSFSHQCNKSQRGICTMMVLL